jgi:hypothetical protein
MSGLSPEAQVRLGSIIRDRLRDERHRMRLNAGSEPPWMAELDDLASRMLTAADDAVIRRRAYNKVAARNYRNRLLQA